MSKSEVAHLLTLPGVTVQKRKRFKMPKTRPAMPPKNSGQDHFRGRPLKGTGRIIIIKDGVCLEEPLTAPPAQEG